MRKRIVEHFFAANIRNDSHATLGMWAEADKHIPVSVRAKFGGQRVDALAYRCSRCGCAFDEDAGGRSASDATCSECYADADQLFITQVRWSGFCLTDEVPQ